MGAAVPEFTAIEQPILVIGDIHHRTVEAELLIERNAGRFEAVVFLGDYFDDFGDTPERMQCTCRWLNESLRQPNRVHLLGNHDLSYFNPVNAQLSCPGWSTMKQRVFDCECRELPRDRLFLAARVGSWVLSHAGFHRALIGGLGSDELVSAANDALKHALSGHPSPFLGCGYSRGGGDPFGGVTWLDWSEEFRPVEGIHQIVGHTPASGIVRGHHLSAARESHLSEIYSSPGNETLGSLSVPGKDWLSVNWCIDTQQQSAALILGNDCQFV